MKLAEALILRADHQKRLEQLRQRLVRSAKIQEGEKAPENPTQLIKELEDTASELAALIRRINLTNSASELPDGMSLTDALAQRDVLGKKQSIYRDLAQAAVVTQDRYSRSEVKFKSTVSVAEMQERADLLAREYRELDALIQETNWKVDLAE